MWALGQQAVLRRHPPNRRLRRHAQELNMGHLVDDEPNQLRRGIEDNLRTLRVDQIPIVNLRLSRQGPPDVFFEEQLAAMIAARDDGLIAAVGLSNITVAHLHYARRLTDVACVQNAYNIANRASQPVLDACTQLGIAFVPFAPLASGVGGRSSALAAPQVESVAARIGSTPVQVALAWLLAVAPNILLIAGTT